MELCALCKKNKTGRLIEGVPVCGRCYLAGQYNLPENQAKLAEGDLTEPAPAPSAKVNEGEGFRDYLCPQCNVTHRAGSKIHKRHLKLL